MSKKWLRTILAVVLTFVCAFPLVACGAVDVDAGLDKNKKANDLQSWVKQDDCTNFKEMLKNHGNYKMNVYPITFDVGGSEAEGYTFSNNVYGVDAMYRVYSSDTFDIIDLSECGVTSINDTTLAQGYGIETIDSGYKVYTKTADSWSSVTKTEIKSETAYILINSVKSPRYLKTLTDNLANIATADALDGWYKNRMQSDNFRLANDASDSYFVDSNDSQKLYYLVKNEDGTGKLIAPTKFYYTGVRFNVKETAENSGEYALDTLSVCLYMFDEDGNSYGMSVDFTFGIDMTEVTSALKA